jgi:hypothetical protein
MSSKDKEPSKIAQVLEYESRRENFAVRCALAARSDGFLDEEFPSLFERVLEIVQSRNATQ